MIFHTEQTHIGEPVNPEDSPWKPTEIFGILEVDAVIGPALKDGGVAVISGSTGSGKTVLAGQVAACMAMSGQNVHFISTEVEEPELLARTLSCLAPWPYRMLKDGVGLEDMGGFKLPVVFPDDNDFSVKALHPYRMLQKHLHVTFRPDFKVDPMEVIFQEIAKVRRSGAECLILDLLQLDGKTKDQKELATMIMEYLTGNACELGIPIFVFCQRNDAGDNQDRKEVKSGRVGGISEFPQIEKLADVTIELTYPVSRPSERLVDPGTFSRDRHFIVRSKGKSGEKWIPVTADFEFQRFIGREESGNLVNEDDDEFCRRVRRSERKGFVKFPREVMARIYATGHQPTVFIYLAMVLGADENGMLYWSEYELGRLFNFKRAVPRRAIEKLQEIKLIKCVDRFGSSQCRVWEVVGFKEMFMSPEVRDYVVIARNLMDDNKQVLRHDSIAFSVWITLLFEARYTPDVDGSLERGQWQVNYPGLAKRFKMSEVEIEDAFSRLEEQGRIRRWVDSEWGDEIVILTNYDLFQCMLPWSKSRPSTSHRRTNEADFARTNEVFEADQRRTIDEPTTDQRQTIDEPTTDHKEDMKTRRPVNL